MAKWIGIDALPKMLTDYDFLMQENYSRARLQYLPPKARAAAP